MFKFKTPDSCSINILQVFFVLITISFCIVFTFLSSLHPAFHLEDTLLTMLLTPFVDTLRTKKINLLISVLMFQTPENRSPVQLLCVCYRFLKRKCLLYSQPLSIQSVNVQQWSFRTLQSFFQTYMRVYMTLASILRGRAHFLTKTFFQSIMLHKFHRKLRIFSEPQSNDTLTLERDLSSFLRLAL